MKAFKPLKIFIWGMIIIFIVIGCSPSSYSERYNKPDSKGKQSENKKTVRFTSEDDESGKNPETESIDNVTTYANPQEEFDETPTEEYPVDISALLVKHNQLANLGGVLTNREKVLFEVLNYIDTPYKYGGNNKEGIDCSAFTQNIFNKVFDEKLPRTAREQYGIGTEISSKENLKFGDLVFFNTTTRSYPGHVGIYLGDNLFAHSSRSKGVTISSFRNKYYSNRFISGRRVENFK